MQRVRFGKTGLEVSVAGLGCGGHSRLGTRQGRSFLESVEVVRSAVDLGVNYIDTAPAYGTEEIVGAALVSCRDQVVVSTKAMPTGPDGLLLDGAALRRCLEHSLKRLRTDRVDVFHLHSVTRDIYRRCLADLVPELLSLRDKGMIRFIALSERFASDPGHLMLERAVDDDCWDVVMVGFNLLNPSARQRVLQAAQAKGIAVEVMYAVRRALSEPAALRDLFARLIEDGRMDPGASDVDDPLGFLVHPGGASSVIDAAYRFARHEPGCHVVLTGTGNAGHLAENVRSLLAPPMPEADLKRLGELFGSIDDLSGN